jgi:cytochrome b6-f complex iron-sulfur subunit
MSETSDQPSTTTQSGASVGASKPPRRKKDVGPSRRTFLRNSWLAAWLGVLAGFGGASLGFLWPKLQGGFGAVIEPGNAEEILSEIRNNKEPFYYPAGRFYLVEYDPSNDPNGEYETITNGAPLRALYQKCVHLGCKVPWCKSAQWFQCPCHGSNYNRWGEYQLGPAPRGLDRFSLKLNNSGGVEVDTSKIVTGPPRTTQALGQPKEGPDCV